MKKILLTKLFIIKQDLSAYCLFLTHLTTDIAIPLFDIFRHLCALTVYLLKPEKSAFVFQKITGLLWSPHRETKNIYMYPLKY